MASTLSCLGCWLLVAFEDLICARLKLAGTQDCCICCLESLARACLVVHGSWVLKAWSHWSDRCVVRVRYTWSRSDGFGPCLSAPSCPHKVYYHYPSAWPCHVMEPRRHASAWLSSCCRLIISASLDDGTSPCSFLKPRGLSRTLFRSTAAPLPPPPPPAPTALYICSPYFLLILSLSLTLLLAFLLLLHTSSTHLSAPGKHILCLTSLVHSIHLADIFNTPPTTSTSHNHDYRRSR